MKTTLILALLAVAGFAHAGALDGVPIIGHAGGSAAAVYQKSCLSGDGYTPGFVVVKGQQAGCLIEEGANTNVFHIEWLASGKIEKLMFPPTPVPANNGVPTRADVARTMNQRTYDQYGRPVKSTAELCAEAQAAGGPVTQICAMNRWAQ